jgi:hypothetical protein
MLTWGDIMQRRTLPFPESSAWSVNKNDRFDASQRVYRAADGAVDAISRGGARDGTNNFTTVLRRGSLAVQCN